MKNSMKAFYAAAAVIVSMFMLAGMFALGVASKDSAEVIKAKTELVKAKDKAEKECNRWLWGLKETCKFPEDKK